MRRRQCIALLLTPLLFAPLRARADEAEDEQNPHLMVMKDGSPNTDKCGFCHNDDLTLSQPKEQLCLTCHTVGEHGGSMFHLQARPDVVKQRVPTPKPGEIDFPLTDAGGIYCGTCHLFHDPGGVVTGEKWLPEGCPEATSEFATGVGSAFDKYRDSIGDAQAAHIVKTGTRALRLSACNGALCLHCHGDKR